MDKSVIIEDDRVSISKEYLEELQKAAMILYALEAGGVDNWEWYGDSLRDIALVDDNDEE